MVTVNCGYEGCDWKKEYPTTELIQGIRCLGLTALIKHYIHEHHIPPAIWER